MISAGGFACGCPRCGSTDLTNGSDRTLASGEKKPRYKCRECAWHGSGVEYAEQDVIEATVKQANKAQKYQDINRVERKAFRESARVLNAHETINDALVSTLESHQFKTPKTPKIRIEGSVGVIQLSDLHFNELIDLSINKYNFRIASQRLQKFMHKSIAEFKANGVKSVIVASTGDLLNSDRRLDEITAAATNRTNAMVLAVEIMQQCLQDLLRYWHVDFFWVCGNEGRVNKELGFNKFVASDNYDHAIPMMLKHLFANNPGIEFHPPDNPMEQMFSVNGSTWCLIHGHGGGGGQPTAKAEKVRAKYAEQGVCIDYVIWGHIHEAYISELFGRSGSPSGANTYSLNGLGLGGKASQNLYIIESDGDIAGKMIPLQKYESYEGYDFDESLIAYNTKSLSKTLHHTTVFEVVV